MAPAPFSALRGPNARAVAALSATQLIGWGTTYYLPALLSFQIARDVGLSRTLVFAGITTMLVVTAALSPLTGRLLVRHGARPVMMAGSVAIAIGLAALSRSVGLASYMAAWAVIGIGGAFAFTQAASTAMVQISPAGARSAIGVILLVSGLSSTASWPVIIALDGSLGWRATLLVFAAVHLAVCLPLHAVGLAAALPREAGHASADAPPAIAPRVRHERSAFVLSALTFSLAGLLSWGIPLNLLDILRSFGHAEAAAVAIGTLFGPAQLVARLLDLAIGRRLNLFYLGVGLSLATSFAILILAAGGGSVVVAVAFMAGFGIAAGWMALLRAIVPLHLFGSLRYPTILGRLSVPQNLAFALAPAVFAAIAEGWGYGGLLRVALGLSLAALVLMVLLAWREA